MKDELILVTGAGGFIGGSMVADFRRQGYKRIRAVDIKPIAEWYQLPGCREPATGSQPEGELRAQRRGRRHVYNFAANMGGMGFIESNKALCMLSVLINTHMLEAAQQAGAQRYFYASSACVYNADKQRDVNNPGLKEEDAYPAMPEDGYGWEKLFSERMCRHFPRRLRPLHAHGPLPQRLRAERHLGRRTREGPRRHLPQSDSGEGQRKTRNQHLGYGRADSQLHVYRRLREGIKMIMASDIVDAINLGSSEMVTVNQLVDIVEDIAGIKLKRSYDLSAPKGVNGRNSDNTLIQKLLGWEPNITLRAGLEKTYAWIYDQYMARENKQAYVL